MNRLMGIVMVLGVLWVTGSTTAIYRQFDDFQDEPIGPLNGQDAWYSQGGDNRIVEDPADPLNQVLYVPSESSIIRKSLPVEHTGIPDGTARMLFLRFRISQKQTFAVGLSGLRYPSEFSDFAPEIGLANSAKNLDLRVWDDEEGNFEFVQTLVPDRWYNLWVRVDALLNSYEVWLNDIPGADASEADKLAAGDGDDVFDFRSGTNSDLLTFFIKTAGGNSGPNFGPVYFDDIYLELSGDLNLRNPIVLEEPIPGDADRDGGVNLIDLGIVAGSWFLGPEPAVSWEAGNFDFNDTVDITDLLLLAENWLSIRTGE
ncbi:MAG: hypothetical protein GX455_10200 [Phycisphaerae bacterium]|nr:hypothetical protein [Phycisphaerae bacterium]